MFASKLVWNPLRCCSERDPYDARLTCNWELMLDFPPGRDVTEMVRADRQEVVVAPRAAAAARHVQREHSFEGSAGTWKDNELPHKEKGTPRAFALFAWDQRELTKLFCDAMQEQFHPEAWRMVNVDHALADKTLLVDKRRVHGTQGELPLAARVRGPRRAADAEGGAKLLVSRREVRAQGGSCSCAQCSRH
jgi:hypothetical protein